MQQINYKAVLQLCFLWVLILFSSCRTIATYDAGSFQKTSVLKAKTLVMMDHATEDYNKYSDKIDDILIEAESIYAMQKSREKNAITIGQWQKLMQKDSITHQSVLPGFFALWKTKKILSQDYIDFAKEQVADSFDEIIKLEGAKLKN